MFFYKITYIYIILYRWIMSNLRRTNIWPSSIIWVLPNRAMVLYEWKHWMFGLVTKIHKNSKIDNYFVRKINNKKLYYFWGCLMLSIQLVGGCGQVEKFCNGWPNLNEFSDDDGNPPICSWPKVFITWLTLDLEEFKLLTGWGNW